MPFVHIMFWSPWMMHHNRNKSHRRVIICYIAHQELGLKFSSVLIIIFAVAPNRCFTFVCGVNKRNAIDSNLSARIERWLLTQPSIKSHWVWKVIITRCLSRWITRANPSQACAAHGCERSTQRYKYYKPVSLIKESVHTLLHALAWIVSL
jgi:hypothetical protein